MRDLTTLTYEEHGPLATVTLNRPEQGNRINVPMLQDLAAVCDHLEDASEARVVVFRGAGGVFSEGIDFGDFDPGRMIDIHGFNKWEKAVVRLERLPKVTVAVVDGPAVGGGFQLALAMDQRIASPRASFRLPEVHLGFLPGMATFRLARYVGLGHAKRILLCTPTVEPEEALRLGIVDKVASDLDAALADTVASFGPIHTVAVQLARRLLNESFGTEFEDALGHFLAAQHRAVTQTAFLDTLKRARGPR